MIMFTETIAPPPPLVPLTVDEQMKLIVTLAQEDRWVKDFIERLAGTIREMSTERR